MCTRQWCEDKSASMCWCTGTAWKKPLKEGSPSVKLSCKVWWSKWLPTWCPLSDDWRQRLAAVTGVMSTTATRPRPIGPRLVGDGGDTSWLVRTINWYVTPFGFGVSLSHGACYTMYPWRMSPLPAPLVLHCGCYRIVPPTKRRALAGPDRQCPAVQALAQISFYSSFWILNRIINQVGSNQTTPVPYFDLNQRATLDK